MSALPRTLADPIDIIAELRRQLDERDAKLATVDAQVEALRRVLIGTAEDLSEQERPWELRGAHFWFASWTNSNRRIVQLTSDLETHRQWHLEHGREAARLQTERDLARYEHGVVSSMLDATQARVDDLERELDRARQRLAQSSGSSGSREVD